MNILVFHSIKPYDDILETFMTHFSTQSADHA